MYIYSTFRLTRRILHFLDKPVSGGSVVPVLKVGLRLMAVPLAKNAKFRATGERFCNLENTKVMANFQIIVDPMCHRGVPGSIPMRVRILAGVDFRRFGMFWPIVLMDSSDLNNQLLIHSG